MNFDARSFLFLCVGSFSLALGDGQWMSDDAISAALSADSPCDGGGQCSVELLQSSPRRLDDLRRSASQRAPAKRESDHGSSSSEVARRGLDDLLVTSIAIESEGSKAIRATVSWLTSSRCPQPLILFLLLLLLALLLRGSYTWLCNHRFLTCQAKVRNVVLAWSVPGETRPLCAICVEFLKPRSSRKDVEFYCGHRFHKTCVNHWLTEHPGVAASCPMCTEDSRTRPRLEMVEEEGAHGALQKDEGNHKVKEEAENGPSQKDEANHEVKEEVEIDEEQRELEPADAEGLHAASSSCSPDIPAPHSEGSRTAFIVRVLHKKYPDIISGEMAARWPSFSSDVWLAELQKPEGTSAFSWIRFPLSERTCCILKFLRVK